MATRRKVPSARSGSEDASPVAQQDEGNILTELGVEPDEDSGDLLIDEDKALELGALDAESVRENRRIKSLVDKKRANVSKVSFNTGDMLTKYDNIVKVYPANTLDINVRRLTGTPVQHVIISRPNSGAELYEAMKVLHGQQGEADYELSVVDNSRKEYRGKGKITMPDTRPQQGQPMTNPYYPPGYPPGYPYPPPPQQQQSAQAPPPQPQSSGAAPPPPPPPVIFQAPPAPAGPDMSSMFGVFRQMVEMVQAMQQPPPQQPQVPVPPLPPPQFVMPPPPANPDMASMMTYLQQMFEMSRTMQPAQAAPPALTAQPARAETPPNPMAMMGMPPITPPPGMFWVPGLGFVPIAKLMEAMNPSPSPSPRLYPSRMERMSDDGRPPPYVPREPPSREKTAREMFDEAIGVVRTAVEVQREFASLIPGGSDHHVDEEPSRNEDDDSPIRIIDTGQGKIVVNKKDGTMRPWETGLANVDKILKWTAEQTELIRKAATERQQQAQQPQQLPPGYVEVREGYRPPPGYIAVPEQPPYVAPQQQQQSPLPPPPDDLPPPVQRTWSAPTIPERET